MNETSDHLHVTMTQMKFTKDQALGTEPLTPRRPFPFWPLPARRARKQFPSSERALILATAAGHVGCSHPHEVRAIGSDAMSNVTQSWAEEYGKASEVSGGGTGLGLAALLNGSAPIAMSARAGTERASEADRKIRRSSGSNCDRLRITGSLCS